jgi:hypothetical protein
MKNPVKEIEMGLRIADMGFRIVSIWDWGLRNWAKGLESGFRN